MPAPTIIATPGAVDANSFGTLAEAEIYHNTQYHLEAPWPSDVSATAAIGSGTNGIVTITVDAVGVGGNLYTVTVVLAVGNNQPLSAALVGTDLTVTLGTGVAGLTDPAKNTAVLVAAAIEALAGLSAKASGTGATVIPVTATILFTGGLSYDTIKSQALIMATQWITALVGWTGYETTTTQRLPWPRETMLLRNEQDYVLDTVVPEEVKAAQFELARLLISADRTSESGVYAQGISFMRAGPISLMFRDKSTPPPVLPDIVTDLLVPSWVDSVKGQPSGMRELLRA